MIAWLVGLGVLAAVVGVPVVLFARVVAYWRVRIDLVGARDPEPSGRLVAWTRTSGILLVLGGAYLVACGLHPPLFYWSVESALRAA